MFMDVFVQYVCICLRVRIGVFSWAGVCMCVYFHNTCGTAAHDDRGAGSLAVCAEAGAEDQGGGHGGMAGLGESRKQGTGGEPRAGRDRGGSIMSKQD